MSRARRRRGRPSVTPSRSTKKTGSPGLFGCVTHVRKPAGHEGEVRIGIAWFVGALRRRSDPRVGPAGRARIRPLRKNGPERVDVGGNVRRAQTGSEAPVQESGSGMEGPVQTLGKAHRRLMLVEQNATEDRRQSNRAFGASSSVKSSGLAGIKVAWRIRANVSVHTHRQARSLPAGQESVPIGALLRRLGHTRLVGRGSARTRLKARRTSMDVASKTSADTTCPRTAEEHETDRWHQVGI